MTGIEMVALGAGLALDAVVVAVAAGACMQLRLRTVLWIGFVFGVFQAGMPLLGYALGTGFSNLLASYASIIGFVLLLGVGLKMLQEAFGEDEAPRDVTRMGTLFALAVATSIDALVVGVTFAFIPVSVSAAVLTIGTVTFGLSVLGALLATRVRGILGSRIEIVGALVLIVLAFKTLLV